MTPMRSGTRNLAGACLLWLATLLFLAIFGHILAALIPPLSRVPMRLLIGLAVASAMLVAAAATIHDRGVVWQTPLRGFAFAAVLVGMAYLINALGHGTLLLSPAGALCAGYVLAGLGAARMLSYPQHTRRGHAPRPLADATANRDEHAASAHPPPGTLRSVRAELGAGTYFENAAVRATRRKSAWNLLLVLVFPLWVLLWGAGVWVAQLAKTLLPGGHAVALDWTWLRTIAPLFAYFPLLFATLLPAMVLVNYFIYYLVPPARRAMDAEDRAFAGTEYATQQPLLLRLSWMIVPPAFLLALIGQIFL